MAGSVWTVRAGSRHSRMQPASVSARPSRRSAPRSRTSPPSDEIEPLAKSAVTFLRLTAGRSNGRRVSSATVAWRIRCLSGKTFGNDFLPESNDLRHVRHHVLTPWCIIRLRKNTQAWTVRLVLFYDHFVPDTPVGKRESYRLRCEVKSMPIETMKSYAGRDQSKINRFLEQFVYNIRACNRKYYQYAIDNWGYPHHNLLYSERQCYSLMAAAMHQLTPAHQSESKVIKRKDRRNPIHRDQARDATGRVDLWAHMDDVDYYFEFKRSYCGIRYLSNGKRPNRMHKPWKSLVDQVKQVRAGLQDEPNACCVGLQVITPFKTARSEERLAGTKILPDSIEKFMTRFQPMPSAVLWYPNDKKSRIVPIEWDERDKENRWGLYPIHLFLFTIV